MLTGFDYQCWNSKVGNMFSKGHWIARTRSICCWQVLTITAQHLSDHFLYCWWLTTQRLRQHVCVPGKADLCPGQGWYQIPSSEGHPVVRPWQGLYQTPSCQAPGPWFGTTLNSMVWKTNFSVFHISTQNMLQNIFKQTNFLYLRRKPSPGLEQKRLKQQNGSLQTPSLNISTHNGCFAPRHLLVTCLSCHFPINLSRLDGLGSSQDSSGLLKMTPFGNLES